jgi:hypothetical protein
MCNNGVPFHYAITNRALPNGSKRSDQIFRDFYWQTGYGAFPVRYSDIEPVVRYIENRHAHHSEMSFLQGRSCCGAAHRGLHPPLMYFALQGGSCCGAAHEGLRPRWGILPLQGRSCCGAAHEGLRPPLMYFAPTGQGVLRGRSRGAAPRWGILPLQGRSFCGAAHEGLHPPAGVFCPCRAGRAAGPLTRGCTPRWGILPLQGNRETHQILLLLYF